MKFLREYTISTHAPAGGRRLPCGQTRRPAYFYSRPCGRGRQALPARPRPPPADFYSHPCGRGDSIPAHWCVFEIISTHAPAGGATRSTRASRQSRRNFYSRPCGGRHAVGSLWRPPSYFYSRPCGRGDDVEGSAANTAGVFLLTPPAGGGDIPQLHPSTQHHAFLLTPLREGRPAALHVLVRPFVISTHAPAGGATSAISRYSTSG